MFPRLISLLAVCMSCRLVYSAYCTVIAVLGECYPPGRDSSLNLLVWVFVSGVVSLSQGDVAFNALDLTVVDILVCRFPSSPLYTTCSSSDPDFYFHQLIIVAFVAAHMVYYD